MGIESLLQLGFAAAIAVWLVFWLTNSFQTWMQTQTKALVAIQLLLAEQYVLIVMFEAQMRGFNREPTEEDTAEFKAAKANYDKLLDRWDVLRKRLSEQLVDTK